MRKIIIKIWKQRKILTFSWGLLSIFFEFGQAKISRHHIVFIYGEAKKRA